MIGCVEPTGDAKRLLVALQKIVKSGHALIGEKRIPELRAYVVMPFKLTNAPATQFCLNLRENLHQPIIITFMIF
jgi:hypothetical protein